MEPEIFERLIISNTEHELIFYQIRILRIISTKFKVNLSNKQYDQILEKYQQLLDRSEDVRYIYSNHMYVICAISLMLSEFMNPWQSKFNQFKMMSERFMENAERTINRIKKN